MSRIRVETELAATPAEVWADVRDISTHVEWMHDAASITFTSEQVEGTGTTFDCLTRVGPLKLVDKMQITSWVEAAEMGVRHVGLVTGEGAFTLTAAGADRTLFVWDETLRFPWWMGGPIGGFFGAIVLKQIWERNLGLLRARFEA